MNNIKEKEKWLTDEEILQQRKEYIGKKMILDDIFSVRRNELKGKTATILSITETGDFKVEVDYDKSEIEVFFDIDDFTIQS